jgi:hypothetical protein
MSPSIAPTCSQWPDPGEVRRARQAGHDGGGLPVQRAEVLVAAVRDRRGAGNAVPREVRHEVQVEGQLGRGEALEQRQDKAPVRGGDEVVGVLDPGGDALQLDERADRVALQPGRQLFGSDAREDRHDARASVRTV